MVNITVIYLMPVILLTIVCNVLYETFNSYKHKIKVKVRVNNTVYGGFL
jgi:hypothetical protein